MSSAAYLRAHVSRETSEQHTPLPDGAQFVSIVPHVDASARAAGVAKLMALGLTEVEAMAVAGA